ncbi:MAG: succinate dehydrogenase, hydrophobic membrane anchor protein [Legionellaceae bacterium]|nr:succinate dehydrogenase, hydrophobic membrane anchor protein [Legionellaceae bacterium]
MGGNFLSVPGKGLREWLIQRVTAVYLGVYTFFIMVCVFALPATYSVWHNLFANFWLVIINTFMLVCVLWHAWIGGWTIITDYVSVPYLRDLCKLLLIVFLLALFLWGLQIFWHIHAVGRI